MGVEQLHAGGEGVRAATVQPVARVQQASAKHGQQAVNLLHGGARVAVGAALDEPGVEEVGGHRGQGFAALGVEDTREAGVATEVEPLFVAVPDPRGVVGTKARAHGCLRREEGLGHRPARRERREVEHGERVAGILAHGDGFARLAGNRGDEEGRAHARAAGEGGGERALRGGGGAQLRDEVVAHGQEAGRRAVVGGERALALGAERQALDAVHQEQAHGGAGNGDLALGEADEVPPAAGAGVQLAALRNALHGDELRGLDAPAVLGHRVRHGIDLAEEPRVPPLVEVQPPRAALILGPGGRDEQSRLRHANHAELAHVGIGLGRGFVEGVRRRLPTAHM